MLKRCIIAENRKLHASPIWVIFFVLPLISAGYGTFNYLQNLEILTERWYSLWTQHTLFYSMLFFPAMVSAYAAYLWRLEHLGHNWNLIMAAPVRPFALFAAKLLVVVKLMCFTQCFVFVLYVACGRLFAGFSDWPPVSIVFYLVRGIFGGLASSTATTMMFSRHARNHADLVRMSAIVILIANVMVMIRLGLVAGVVAPHLAKPIAIVFLCGIVPGVAMALYGWKVLSGAENLPMPEVKNPTELKTAVSFGLLYALVLLASAWLQDVAGNSGLYIVALVSGLTDADASVLSTLRMFNLDKVASGEAVIAVTLALMANLVFKIGLVLSIGGGKLARHALPGLLAIGGGMAAGLLLV